MNKNSIDFILEKEREEYSDYDYPIKQGLFSGYLFYLNELAFKNKKTIIHSQLVASYAVLLAETLKIKDKEFIATVSKGALLHDIGKIGIPRTILIKAGPLTEEEKLLVRDHPYLGYEMLKPFNFLKKPAKVVLYHHEQYNGRGYPCGLKGEAIPLEARIVALADTFDALTSGRPYQQGMSIENAKEEMKKNRWRQFDPFLVNLFLTLSVEILQTKKKEASPFP